MIIDIEACDIFDDDSDYFNNTLLFKIRDDDGNLYENVGGMMKGDVNEAFYLQRIISQYIENVYVCVLSGNINDNSRIEEKIYSINGSII